MDLLGFRAVRVHGHERLVVAQTDMQNLFLDSDSEMSLLLVRGGLTDFGRRPVWQCRAERVPCGHTEAESEDLYDTLIVHLGVGTAKDVHRRYGWVNEDLFFTVLDEAIRGMEEGGTSACYDRAVAASCSLGGVVRRASASDRNRLNWKRGDRVSMHGGASVPGCATTGH